MTFLGKIRQVFEVREGEPMHFNIKLELKSFWQRILE